MSDYKLTPEELARVEQGHREMMKELASDKEPIDLTKDDSEDDSGTSTKDK